jgi:hypothetical protein
MILEWERRMRWCLVGAQQGSRLLSRWHAPARV